jgi:hypothetical protein
VSRLKYEKIYGEAITLVSYSSFFNRWENSGKDMLTCNECKGSLCVKFHPELSFESKVQLTDSYRILLATSHKKVCKHYTEAERWLFSNDYSSERDVKFVVPPYFLRFGIEFQLLQDLSKDEYRTRKHILSCALSLSNSMMKADAVDWSQFDDIEVKNLVFQHMKSLKVPINSLSSLVLPQNKYIEDNEDIQVDDKLIEHSVFMVVFGWRKFDATVRNDKSNLNNGEYHNIQNDICVQCPMCLTNIVIYNNCDGEDKQPKRRRFDEAEGGNSSPTFHILNSHRSYCPFVKGFTQHETSISGTSKPCWKVTLDILSRRWNSSEQDGTSDKNCLSVDEKLAFIRNTLRSSIKPKTVV